MLKLGFRLEIKCSPKIKLNDNFKINTILVLDLETYFKIEALVDVESVADHANCTCLLKLLQ